MGIPGLARHLEPYASHHSPQNLKGYCAIIDGPALAYHAQKIALAVSSSQSSIPSYADIVTQGLRWLESLESINIQVSMVFFDGALPVEKRPERLLRTEQSNKGIKQFRLGYPTAACPIPNTLGSKLYAFLAPALREALNESPFASRTYVVAGEADDWCALHARKNERSIIFTSDTDLILFDYAPKTLVSFLQDADLSMGVRAYSPVKIRQQLQLKSLVLFAFALKQDPPCSTTDLIRKAKNVDESSKDYLDFQHRYAFETMEMNTKSNSIIPTSQLQNLDVRVSEFVHECKINSAVLMVYLPLLVEDANQASAWSMSQNIRTLAYSLLAPQNSIIHEHRRKAQSITVEEIHPYTNSNIFTPATELNRQIGIFSKWADSKSTKPEIFWPIFALSLVLRDTNIPLPLSLILRVLNSDFDNTWSFIHLLSRLQATLYSLRILKQIITVYLTCNPKQTAQPNLIECLSNLSTHFTTFPSIPSMFAVPGQKANVLAKHDELEVLVQDMCRLMGLEVPVDVVSSKKKKKKKEREAERKKKVVDGNIFSVLDR